jgi:hypothetical protein
MKVPDSSTKSLFEVNEIIPALVKIAAIWMNFSTLFQNPILFADFEIGLRVKKNNLNLSKCV